MRQNQERLRALVRVTIACRSCGVSAARLCPIIAMFSRSSASSALATSANDLENDSCVKSGAASAANACLRARAAAARSVNTFGE